MLVYASLSSLATVGEYCTLPQANPMALLFAHDSHEPADEHSVCRQ